MAKRPLRMAVANTLIGALALGFPMLWAGCEGSATQTTNNLGLHGKLVDDEGRPQRGVEVQAYPLGSIGVPGGGASPAGRAVTDAEGEYRFLNLAKDVYNVFARETTGTKGVLIPEVSYAEGDTDLGTHTLVSPGAITGRITVDGEPVPEVFCYIPGSYLAAITDSAGRFILPGLPPGTYSLKLVGHDLESIVKTGIPVRSDSVTALGSLSMLYDSRLAPGTPKELAAFWVDSAASRYGLAWKPPSTGDVAGYLLFAQYFDAEDRDFPKREDTLAIQGKPDPESGILWEDEGYYLFLDSAFRLEDTVLARFRMAAVDSNGNRSPTSSAPAERLFLRPAWMKSALLLSETATGSGDSVCADTLRFKAALSLPGGGPLPFDSLRYIWRLTFHGNGRPLGEFSGKYLDEEGVMHWAEEYGDEIAWWNGHAATAWMTGADSLEAEVHVYMRSEGRLDDRQLRMPFKRDGSGCYRRSGPAYDPKIY